MAPHTTRACFANSRPTSLGYLMSSGSFFAGFFSGVVSGRRGRHRLGWRAGPSARALVWLGGPLRARAGGAGGPGRPRRAVLRLRRPLLSVRRTRARCWRRSRHRRRTRRAESAARSTAMQPQMPADPSCATNGTRARLPPCTLLELESHACISVPKRRAPPRRGAALGRTWFTSLTGFVTYGASVAPSWTMRLP